MTRLKDLPEHTRRAIENALKKEIAKENKTNASWIKTVQDAQNLIYAIEHNEPQVQLTNGRFDILPRFHHGEPTWFVRPADGRFVPCGFFTPMKLKILIAGMEDK